MGIKLFQLLEDEGFSPNAVAGIVANVKHESNFDPRAVGDNGNAVGLFQWNGPRAEAFLDYTDKNKLNPYDPAVQVRYMQVELSDQPKLLKALNEAKSPEEAAAIFTRQFERPADTEGQAKARAATAREAFDYMKTRDNVRAQGPLPGGAGDLVEEPSKNPPMNATPEEKQVQFQPTDNILGMPILPENLSDLPGEVAQNLWDIAKNVPEAALMYGGGALAGIARKGAGAVGRAAATRYPGVVAGAKAVGETAADAALGAASSYVTGGNPWLSAILGGGAGRAVRGAVRAGRAANAKAAEEAAAATRTELEKWIHSLDVKRGMSVK